MSRQVDEDHVVAAVQRERFFHRQGFDLALGGVDQRAKPGGNLLRHDISIRLVAAESLPQVDPRVDNVRNVATHLQAKPYAARLEDSMKISDIRICTRISPRWSKRAC